MDTTRSPDEISFENLNIATKSSGTGSMNIEEYRKYYEK
jgi:hypothetical protein